MSDDDHGGGGGGADEDVGLPKATVYKLIQEMLPPDVVCAKDTRDLLTDCCVANEICENDAKKTIAGEHVITALKNLGFEEYIEELNEVLEDHAKQSKVAISFPDRESRSSKLENSGLSLEELQRVQEELLAKAKANLESGRLAP
ncbi:negative cofactor 2 transcription regulator complex subunit ncb2 [Cladochytrium tenue]|nr:negative cofactor 2 transcription regulator complex subunit ncb2 [Cladochytrium tenue]